MTSNFGGKKTLDLDFVDFCQFQNVFKEEGRFFKVFHELWGLGSSLTPSDHLYHYQRRRAIERDSNI